MIDLPTVFVVEDDPAVRETLSELVASVSLQVKCYPSAEDFLKEYNPAIPGCLVVDMRMPGMTGIELLEKLAAEKSPLPAIVITGHGDVPMTVHAMKLGVFDFLEKPYRPSQLLESISNAIDLDGRKRRYKTDREEVETLLQRLDLGERDVLRGIVAGRTNEAIAERLEVSLRTVQYRRASLMKKLEVSSKAALLDILLPYASLMQFP